MSSNSTCGEGVVSDDAIAQRAYELWEARGCPEGDGQQDWQEAQRQLLSETQVPQSPRSPFSRLVARFRGRAAM